MLYIKNTDEFNKAIQEDFVLVDFFATWCGPCKMLSPVLEELSQKRSISIVKVDVDEISEIASLYRIMSIPTLIVFKKGKAVKQTMGFLPLEALEEWLDA